VFEHPPFRFDASEWIEKILHAGILRPIEGFHTKTQFHKLIKFVEIP
jgi:hypothetical protein